MNTQDLKAKYGEGKTRGIINRAIRAELAGGALVLDLLDRYSSRRDELSDALVAIRQEMEREIRRRYNMNVED